MCGVISNNTMGMFPYVMKYIKFDKFIIHARPLRASVFHNKNKTKHFNIAVSMIHI